MKIQTELWLNNSGGYDWLTDEHLAALKALGWYWEDCDGSSAYPMRIYRDTHAILARAEFELATGFDGSERGCDCCGSPFWFSENEGDDVDEIDRGLDPVSAMGEADEAVAREQRETWAEDEELDPQAQAWLALIGE